MGTVIYPNGKKVFVKNLGWLVRHLGIYKVRVVSVTAETPDSAQLFVAFTNGVDFLTVFASPSVLLDWLQRRRNLKGATLRWNGVETTL